MKYLLVLLLASASVGTTACLSGAHRPAVVVDTLHVRVTGMTCPVNCPPRVQAALVSVRGVESATVDYESRTATVVCGPGVDRSALIRALQRQGFDGAIL